MPAIPRPLLNMIEEVYFVRRWSIHFETSESLRRGGPMTWVAMPNRHDGVGYARATQVKHVEAAFCGWYFVLQVASRMPVRGLLADLDGPLDAESLSLKTRIPKRAFMTTLDAFADEKIGWLGKVPWSQELDFWQNVEQLQTNADVCAHLHTPADARARRRTTPHRKKEDGSLGEVHNGAHEPPTTAHTPAFVRTNAHTPAKMQLQYSTVHDSTSPLPSPKGDKAEPAALVGLIEGRALICEKILGGKNPNRMWGPEAENRLARLVEEGLPRQEIEEIAWFRGLPANDEIPELKARRFPITETTLMNYWGDEATRAAAYRQKNHAALNDAAKKKEPDRWREFLRAIFPEAEELRLPDSFYDLPRDLRERWEREHEEWELKNPEVAA